MESSPQDRHYLEVEADAFFERNFAAADPRALRPHKRAIAERIAAAGVRAPRRVLEYGCAYGDLLAHYALEHGAEAFGVEPSAKAVAFGQAAYGERVRLVTGTMAANPLAADAALRGAFDLVVVDDVFCWVSRETLYRSIAHVDDMLRDGGFLYIREFLPLHQHRNANHHVPGGGVYCYKPRGPHSSIFTASGVYEVIRQEVSLDLDDAWARDRGAEVFESRWSNVVLRKSLADYFE
jgi:SAM-dependent methyltransferase